ncbi:uncharacterized protein LOC109821053 [Asparagus officinalis]|uniref:uncharacterized protein LOC109821053 n=1 Tax=Asparagus officinalis TaxID=4686 RepID=UPI00098E05C7|nr:uncharacterized protein LOC109821053 [Asparagus officinalis]
MYAGWDEFEPSDSDSDEEGAKFALHDHNICFMADEDEAERSEKKRRRPRKVGNQGPSESAEALREKVGVMMKMETSSSTQRGVNLRSYLVRGALVEQKVFACLEDIWEIYFKLPEKLEAEKKLQEDLDHLKHELHMRDDTIRYLKEEIKVERQKSANAFEQARLACLNVKALQNRLEEEELTHEKLSLDKKLTNQEMNYKILCSLTPVWEPKVTITKEAHDLTTLTLDGLIGKPKVHEKKIKEKEEVTEEPSQKLKTIALKGAIDDSSSSDSKVDVSREVAHLSRRI